jgi:hypothetical protein
MGLFESEFKKFMRVVGAKLETESPLGKGIPLVRTSESYKI